MINTLNRRSAAIGRSYGCLLLLLLVRRQAWTIIGNFFVLWRKRHCWRHVRSAVCTLGLIGCFRFILGLVGITMEHDCTGGLFVTGRTSNSQLAFLANLQRIVSHHLVDVCPKTCLDVWKCGECRVPHAWLLGSARCLDLFSNTLIYWRYKFRLRQRFGVRWTNLAPLHILALSCSQIGWDLALFKQWWLLLPLRYTGAQSTL